MNDTVVELQKSVPVAYDVDVVVAGAGVAGTFAAIAAALEGASTVLIDRFGSVGGNIGPGTYSPVGLNPLPGASRSKDAQGSAIPKEPIRHGNAGLAREFAGRYADIGGCISPFKKTRFLQDSSVASYLLTKMLEEAGVVSILSAYIADPIVDGDTVQGIFFENKSGRQAVRAKVVIDATGEADLARRAGAPVIYPKAEYVELDGHAPTGAGFWCYLAGVDWARYAAFMKECTDITEEERQWCESTWGRPAPPHMIRLLRKHWDDGGSNLIQDVCGLCTFSRLKMGYDGDGIVKLKVQPDRPHPNLDMANAEHVSACEAGSRKYAFEAARFLKRHAPGFEDSYLLHVAPFFGARGGPCIEGQYTLTMEDCRQGRQFDDVMYVYGEPRALRWTSENTGEPKWTDVPYRVMIPKQTKGLLAVGRCASGIPDTLLRNRVTVMHMGQAGGIAAAVAAKQKTCPSDLNVKQLQERLLEEGFHLGSRARLKALGLAR